MKSRIVVVMAFSALISGCAHMQPTQSWLRLAERLHPGNPVAVTDAAGAEVRGRVVAVSATSLRLKVAGASRDFAADDVRHLRRDGDSLWNGFAIGAGVGFLFTALSDNVCFGPPDASCTGKQVPKRLTAFAVVTAAGAVIDALRRDRTSLYHSPDRVTISVVPVLVPGHRAVSVAIAVSSR